MHQWVLVDTVDTDVRLSNVAYGGQVINNSIEEMLLLIAQKGRGLGMIL